MVQRTHQGITSGDVFLIKSPEDVFHYFVVISAPERLPDSLFEDSVFLVMLTTKEYWKNDSCIITPKDYSLLTHDSVAAFDMPPSLLLTLGQLQELKEKKQLKIKKPVSMEVLQRLRKGYANSRYQKDKIYQFLFRQGVVD
jgi:hypothetical protein